ncbi:MAG: Flp pilus assembly complex ATPase component TadA [Lentisphaeria bacterium]|nr:Flp pilus assembly complex ATPase component TadA [Lentisphaeria bacterium]
MVHIAIIRPGAATLRATLENGVYLVGSGPDCPIRIEAAGVSRRHAQLVVRDRRVTVMDLGSSNGTSGNGTPFFAQEMHTLEHDTVLRLGSAELQLSFPEPAAAPAVEPDAPAADSCVVELLPVSGVPEAARPMLQAIKKQVHRELLSRLNLKKMVVSGVSENEIQARALETIREILTQLSIPLPDGVSAATLELELTQEAIGLGPLEYMIRRDDLTEIMVNGPDRIYVEKAGKLYRTDTAFADSDQVLAAIERIVSPLGRRIDESSPMVDARLPDGSRVNAVIPPLSLSGPTITIRKFSRTPLQAADLIRFGSVSREIMDFLKLCVLVRKNILISGGTGSGKTTLLNVLSSFLPNRERIVTIEDAAELQLHQEHLVRLEARPPNIEGKGEITIRDLVRNALRMRPDRIVVGECRGGEALDMLQAMNTGHDGSLTTIHANSPRDALARLETLVLMAGFDLPLRAIREQVASAVQIVIQISRSRDGSRKIERVSEITKMEGEVITMQDIFVYRQTGWSEDGTRQTGYFAPTGSMPTFLEEIERANLPIDLDMFSPGRQTEAQI